MEVTGTLERVRVYRPESGWMVGELAVAGAPEPLPVVGVVPAELTPGSEYLFEGEIKHDPKWGKQFKFSALRETLPATTAGVQRYLASGRFPQIGIGRAAKILQLWGSSALEVLDRDPLLLAQIPGITLARAKEIGEAWKGERAGAKVLMDLYRYGLSNNKIALLTARYGSPADALAQLQSDPYRLMIDVEGIGWQTADAIAGRVGITGEDRRRARAGAHHLLRQASEQGHTCLSQAEIVRQARRDLKISEPIIETALQHGEHSGYFFHQGDLWGLQVLRDAETEIATRLLALASEPRELSEGQLCDILALCQAQQLDETQSKAVVESCRCQVLVITGGPGTGKTTTVRTILRAWNVLSLACGDDVLLASPTGKAAMRLSEQAGQPAATVHRTLAWRQQTHEEEDGLHTHFSFGLNEPLPGLALVVDEVSMLDAPLARSLCRALRQHHRVLLVGDKDQLPSVGPGSILRDLITSHRVPVVRLEKIWRQDAGSHLVQGAHAVLRGAMPTFGRNGENLKFWEVPEAEEPSTEADEIQTRVLRLVSAPDGLSLRGFSPEQIQVLCPGHKGAVGDRSLNTCLQAELNPRSPTTAEITLRSKDEDVRILRCGDRVIQTRNNYDLEVFNGEVGRIVTIAEVQTAQGRPCKVIDVDFGDRVISYYDPEYWQLQLAYALTIHKSQGSEFPCVVIPLHTSHFTLLKRQLLYTAMTRAREYCVFVGTRRALQLAINAAEEAQRHTWLPSLLEESRV